MPIIILPLDARPVCYQQVQQLAAIANIPLVLPPTEILGQLKTPAPRAALLAWWRKQCQLYPSSAIIVSLDMAATGGLIAGRVNSESAQDVLYHVETFLTLAQSNHPRFAFSTILRIPNYNNCEEEPDYWDEYGKQLYDYSVLLHRDGHVDEQIEQAIPKEILDDFLSRLKKNAFLNQTYLDWLAEKKLDYLVLGQDDTGTYGLNVQQAQNLKAAVALQQLESNAVIQTGADEVALVLLAKSVWSLEAASPLSVYVQYFPACGKDVVAKFDGIAIQDIVQAKLTAVQALNIGDIAHADLVLLVHCPETIMGDHCSDEIAEDININCLKEIASLVKSNPHIPFALADVHCANGASVKLVETLLNESVDVSNLAGFAGWNTPGNTIGTAVAMGAMTIWAQRHHCFNQDARDKLLYTRILDDAYYQGHIRQVLKQEDNAVPNTPKLQTALTSAMNRLADVFPRLPQPQLSFPCNRFFEIAIRWPGETPL